MAYLFIITTLYKKQHEVQYYLTVKFKKYKNIKILTSSHASQVHQIPPHGVGIQADLGRASHPPGTPGERPTPPGSNLTMQSSAGRVGD